MYSITAVHRHPLITSIHKQPAISSMLQHQINSAHQHPSIDTTQQCRITGIFRGGIISPAASTSDSNTPLITAWSSLAISIWSSPSAITWIATALISWNPLASTSANKWNPIFVQSAIRLTSNGSANSWWQQLYLSSPICSMQQPFQVRHSLQFYLILQHSKMQNITQ
jgi:hypothetical protein